MIKPFLFAKPPYWQIYKGSPWFAGRSEKPEWSNSNAMRVCVAGFILAVPLFILAIELTENGYVALTGLFLGLAPSIYLFFRKTGYHVRQQPTH